MNWQEAAFLLAAIIAASSAAYSVFKVGRASERITSTVTKLEEYRIEDRRIIDNTASQLGQHTNLTSRLHVDQDEFREWRRRMDDKMDKLMERVIAK